MSRTVTSYAQWFTNAVAAAADTAWTRYMREPGVFALYLYFKPFGLDFKVVADGEPVPPGYELITSERIPSDKTREQVSMWMHPLCSRAPVLPND